MFSLLKICDVKIIQKIYMLRIEICPLNRYMMRPQFESVSSGGFTIVNSLNCSPIL